jgi:sigma-B regulation protein RsbU (phosphoserine phosphatase)
VNLKSGDLLLLFTDGLVEAEDSSGEPFGEDKLIDVVRTVLDLRCSDIVQRIHQTIADFTGGKLVDDFTVVAVKVE